MLQNVSTPYFPRYNGSAFQAFSSAPAVEKPKSSIEDSFLDPKQSLGSKQALGWFFSGLTLVIAVRWAMKGLFPQKKLTEAFKPGFETTNILKSDPEKRDVLNISQSFGGALDSIYRLAQLDPSHRNTLLAYLGSGIVGYISGNVVQGTQETWVRREETKIRSKLINGLLSVMAQSIVSKQDFDNALREQTKQDILEILKKYNVPNPESFVGAVPALLEQQTILQKYHTFPISRRIGFGAEQAGNQTKSSSYHLKQDDPQLRIKLEKGVLFALGILSGWVVQTLARFLKAPLQGSLFKGEKVIYETVHLKDREAWWINGIKNRKNLAIMSGFFGLSALASAGKLLIEGLREIEVTRINAQTELSYQTHNWLSQDPSFHKVTETLAVKNDMQLLEKDMPVLWGDPAALKDRVGSILRNIGRNSAPPYFPMTPPVNLVVARG